MKILQGTAFEEFRTIFLAKLEKLFLVPSKTFDNVRGSFPIGFFIWDTAQEEKFTSITAKVFEAQKVNRIMVAIDKGEKIISASTRQKVISGWVSAYCKHTTNPIGFTGNNGPDYQNNLYLHISSEQKRLTTGGLNNATKYTITQQNIVPLSIYFAVRLCIDATWLNDRDQFLYPNNGWKDDKEFQADCIAYTLFHGQNRISSVNGTNHWIPFTETEMDITSGFASHFMSDFIAGKAKVQKQADLFNTETIEQHEPIHFSPAAQAVMDAGKAIWYYYLHHQDNTKVLFGEPININASFYDIREYFQGRDEKGRMNTTSTDETYNELLANLRAAQKILAKQIEVGVYKYGFLYNGETPSVKEPNPVVNSEVVETRKKVVKPKTKTIVTKSGNQTNIYNISGDLKIDTYIENKK